MKKTILLALMAAVVILGSCKKESKEDPVTPTPTPESDSVNFRFRYYVGLGMIQYLDYKLYATLPGESEKEVSLVNPQSVDANIDTELMKSISGVFGDARASQIAKDSIRVYVIDFAAKKGNFTFRQDVKINNVQRPDRVDIVSGYLAFNPEKKDQIFGRGQNVARDCNASTDTLNFWISNLFRPITFTIE